MRRYRSARPLAQCPKPWPDGRCQNAEAIRVAGLIRFAPFKPLIDQGPFKGRRGVQRSMFKDRFSWELPRFENYRNVESSCRGLEGSRYSSGADWPWFSK